MLITLENFQRVKDSHLELGAFTIIKGESNLGKSSVRRAISSILFGGFKANYLKVDTKQTKIQLDALQLIKSKSTNKYIIGDLTLEKGGRGTPQEIMDLGYKDEFLHIATQYNPLFMLGEATTKTTQRVNKITGLDSLEACNVLIKSDLGQTKTKHTYIVEELKELNLSIEELKDLNNKLVEIEDQKLIQEQLDTYINLSQDVIDLDINIDCFQDVIDLDSYLAIEVVEEIDIQESLNNLESITLLQEYLAIDLVEEIDIDFSRVLVCQEYIDLLEEIEELEGALNKVVEKLFGLEVEIDSHRCVECGILKSS